MKIAEIVDLTAPIYHNCPANPCLPPVRVDLVMNMACSDFRLERLDIPTHAGTHVDAPSHVLADGKALDAIPLSDFMGPATFLDLRALGAGAAITSTAFERHAARIAGCSFVGLYTGWGQQLGFTREYVFDAPWLDPSGAEWLVEHGVSGVCIDHLSVSGSEEENDVAVHQALLSAGILIVEGLVLSPRLLEREQWFLIVLPLHIEGASGAPARAIALALEE
jgi:kynurenine formamidase